MKEPGVRSGLLTMKSFYRSKYDRKEKLVLYQVFLGIEGDSGGNMLKEGCFLEEDGVLEDVKCCSTVSPVLIWTAAFWSIRSR